jgi:serine/threonine protein phosphatase 1
MNFLRMFERPPQRAARFTEGRVGYAVGDIHGRVDLLAQLFDELEARAAADQRDGAPPIVIFLGDYVDRGPHSDKVIDLLLSGRPAGFERYFLRGNHEQIMQAFMDDPMATRAWTVQGGAETLMAYGVRPPAPMAASPEEWQATADALRAAVPPAHIDFLNRLERYVAFGDYAFVHAGVDAAYALEEQTDEDLYWARERFIASRRPFSHRVVHGHTPVEKPYVDHRRIAVDTGAYASGELTAVRLEGEDVGFVSVTNRRPDRGHTPRPGPLVGARNPV